MVPRGSTHVRCGRRSPVSRSSRAADMGMNPGYPKTHRRSPSEAQHRARAFSPTGSGCVIRPGPPAPSAAGLRLPKHSRAARAKAAPRSVIITILPDKRATTSRKRQATPAFSDQVKPGSSPGWRAAGRPAALCRPAAPRPALAPTDTRGDNGPCRAAPGPCPASPPRRPGIG